MLRVWGRLDDSGFNSDPRLAYVVRRSRDRWRERTAPQLRRWTNALYQMARGIFAADQRVVGGMFRAVESGLTPLAALQAATINPAKFLGRSADLTAAIQAVWLKGTYFDRDNLDRLLKTARAQVLEGGL